MSHKYTLSNNNLLVWSSFHNTILANYRILACLTPVGIGLRFSFPACFWKPPRSVVWCSGQKKGNDRPGPDIQSLGTHVAVTITAKMARRGRGECFKFAHLSHRWFSPLANIGVGVGDMRSSHVYCGVFGGYCLRFKFAIKYQILCFDVAQCSMLFNKKGTMTGVVVFDTVE